MICRWSSQNLDDRRIEDPRFDRRDDNRALIQLWALIKRKRFESRIIWECRKSILASNSRLPIRIEHSSNAPSVYRRFARNSDRRVKIIDRSAFIIIIFIFKRAASFFFFFSREEIKLSRETISGSSRRGKKSRTPWPASSVNFSKRRIIFTKCYTKTLGSKHASYGNLNKNSFPRSVRSLIRRLNQLQDRTFGFRDTFEIIRISFVHLHCIRL